MTTQQCSDSDIRKAAVLLKTGNLVAFPTETVYGLGADATNEQAVSAIFAAKGRPSNNPLIVHVSSLDKLFNCIDLTNHPRAEQIRSYIKSLAPFWPGPLSIVVPKAHHITSLVSAGGPTVAIRIPRHPVALKLLEECDRPIAAPSANPSMYISPTTAQHVRDSLGEKVACILDGGECKVGIESTVLSLVDDPPLILRPGAVTREQIEHALGCPVSLQATQRSDDDSLPSPGMLAKHYAPRTKVLLRTAVTTNTLFPAKVGAIVFRGDTLLPFNPSALRILSERGDLSEVAASLFSALRELDAAGLDLIVVDTCEPIGLGAAIMDRLLRASA
jgi:L-threonylcarbamoyladenylate synthase